MAGARYERRLLGVACRRLLGAGGLFVGPYDGTAKILPLWRDQARQRPSGEKITTLRYSLRGPPRTPGTIIPSKPWDLTSSATY